MLSAALYARVRPTTLFAHETAGAARTRHSLRPLSSRGAEITIKPRALRAARSRSHIQVVATSLRAQRSNPSFRTRGGNGLLRGACHRARVRATRWLAMTTSQFGTI